PRRAQEPSGVLRRWLAWRLRNDGAARSDRYVPERSGFRRRVGGCWGTRALTTWERRGATWRGGAVKRTPISLSRRQATSHWASSPSRSMTSSNVLGTFTVPSTCSCAPVDDRLRTTQGNAEKRSLKAMTPDFSTRRRAVLRAPSWLSVGPEDPGTAGPVSRSPVSTALLLDLLSCHLPLSRSGPDPQQDKPSGRRFRSLGYLALVCRAGRPRTAGRSRAA